MQSGMVGSNSDPRSTKKMLFEIEKFLKSFFHIIPLLFQ